jgi:hypothetical protein
MESGQLWHMFHFRPTQFEIKAKVTADLTARSSFKSLSHPPWALNLAAAFDGSNLEGGTGANVMHQGVNTLHICVPREHEAGRAANECIELPSLRS